jgi:hypothetical protein
MQVLKRRARVAAPCIAARGPLPQGCHTGPLAASVGLGALHGAKRPPTTADAKAVPALIEAADVTSNQ